jgi:ribose transport system permease protein
MPPEPSLATRGFGGRAMSSLSPLLGLMAVVIIFLVIPPHHAPSIDQLRTIAVHAVIVGIAALGATLVIASGGLDLSVGSVIALCSVAISLLLREGWPLWAGVAAAVLVGGTCGLYNGGLIVALRLPAFIVTLGTLGFYRGAAKFLSGSRAISAPTHGLEQLTQPAPDPRWLLLAPAVWIMLALAIVMAFVLHRTILGRHALAIGSSEATARLCGVRVGRTRVVIYVVAGLLTGIAGVLQFARLQSGDPTVAVGLELDVIAAVVIGGASLSGGHASVAGALAGAVMMAYLRNRCVVLGWPNWVQEMIVGHIIILAVALDQWRARRSR